MLCVVFLAYVYSFSSEIIKKRLLYKADLPKTKEFLLNVCNRQENIWVVLKGKVDPGQPRFCEDGKEQ